MRDAARGARPPVGADRGRQREPGRHRRAARPAGRERRAHPRPRQRRQPRQGLLRAPRHARRDAASCGCTATPTARPRSSRCRSCSSAIEHARRRGGLAARVRRAGSHRRQPLRRRIVGRSFVLLCRAGAARADHATCSAASSCGARRPRPRSTGARSSTAGRSTPRRWRSRAPSASACARSASSGATARARASRWCGCSSPWCGSSRAARRHVRREVARAVAGAGRRLTCARWGWRWARWQSRRSPGCCCGCGRRAATSRAATASSCSTRCSTSTGCARPASTG